MSHLVQRVQKLDGVGKVVGPLKPVVTKVSSPWVKPQDDDLRLWHAILHDVHHLLKPACGAVQHDCHRTLNMYLSIHAGTATSTSGDVDEPSLSQIPQDGNKESPLEDAIDGALQCGLIVSNAVSLGKQVIGAYQHYSHLGHLGLGHLSML